MLKIGITGGIGSGKTTICKIFETLDIPIYYADLKAKELMVKNEILGKNIALILGKNAYTKDHQLNRNYIAEKIFNDKGLLAELNALVHPEVASDFLKWADQQTQAPYCIKEAAIMFDTDSYKKLDLTILVIAPEKTRIERVANRDNLTFEEVNKRLNNQRDQSENIPLADFIINNDGDRNLIDQVISIHKLILLENHNRKVLS